MIPSARLFINFHLGEQDVAVHAIAAGQECGQPQILAAISLDKIKGRLSDEIAAILGYENSPEVVHRDDLVVL
jgi:glutamate 5-kinase